MDGEQRWVPGAGRWVLVLGAVLIGWIGRDTGTGLTGDALGEAPQLQSADFSRS